MRKILLSLCISALSCLIVLGQKHHDRFEAIDVQHYQFELELTDANDVIQGKANVQVRFKKDISSFALDLVKKQADGKGMSISGLSIDGRKLPFEHSDNKINIRFSGKAGDTKTFTIAYSGIPANGLVIAENKFGERTFFGDNWPDRAQHWLPTVDHPSDKATVEWVITAPDHYQVIGNGLLQESTDLANNRRLTRWKTSVPLATKVMVIGAARFAVEYLGDVYGINVSSWVYPQNRDDGFHDYNVATGILDWFINHVGPYPYSKLANVQSKTMFGGMENAGNIFYSERSVTGERRSAGTIVHEIAHQWFGNSASEANWHHAWLSEGFATYFTNLYYEHAEGRDGFVEREKQQRTRVVAFSKRKFVPIVDTAVEDYMQALNANTYQKGGWILHMLRREVGDENFWKGIRTYYDRYKHSNALTDDLKDVFEEVSGKELDGFFDQWTNLPGQPNIEAKWNYREGQLSLELNQTQNENFKFNLDIEVVYADGSSEKHTIPVTSKTQVWTPTPQTWTLSFKGKPAKIVLDPDTWLLFEGKVSGN